MTDLEKAAVAYHAAVRAHTRAKAVQDAAFKTQAKECTYDAVQAWQDAVAVQEMAAHHTEVALNQLAWAALAFPEVQ